MYLEVLIISIAVAAALADPLPAIQAGIVTTTSGHNIGFINIMSFLGFVPTSFTAKIRAALFNRQVALVDGHEDDASFTKDPKITTLVIICILLEVVVVLAIVWLFLYTYILWRREKNAERRRAEELLNSHPQPIDIELGNIHTGSTPHPSLTSNNEIVSTTPNTSEHQNIEGGYIRAEAPVGPDDGIQTSVSNASDAKGRAITKAAVPEICVTDTETLQASKLETNNSGLGIATSHTHDEKSFLEPSTAHPTYHSTSYRQESEATEHNTTESSDSQDRFLTSTVSK
ncbi:hypothetical protein FHL15_008468 [Xylaria flabelliformis]|uniref:Sodium/calcium exchanger membrane region domain-containing protein n=1 Tax=Xylaria flabelliformis TaxID=2512241 RepID=A0A553HRY7_9PEZI|nr:hypothetical protein FHL15_008468 [Xylaria flabelliformis]